MRRQRTGSPSSVLCCREGTCGSTLSIFVAVKTEQTQSVHNEGIEAASQHGQLRGEFWREFLKIAIEVYLGLQRL